MKIQANGIEIAFDIKGEGTPIVLLHAFPLNRSMWQPQIDFLSRFCKIIAPDLGGFGETEPRDQPSLMQSLAGDVLALLESLDFRQCVVCGLSMGGYIAFELWRQCRESVKALILADTRAEADTADARKARKTMADSVLETGVAPIADMMPEKLLGKTTYAQNKDMVEHVRKLIAGNHPQAISNAQLGMMQRPDSTPDLAKIACPVLVIVGEEDLLTPRVHSEKMSNEIPNATLAVIPSAGHLSNLEQPAEFNRAIADFLKKIEGKE
jgi:pimeloyl-ACP methyl ester carboxylesterase